MASLKPIRRDKMGEGWYYYHVAPLDRLESIKKLGLTTRERHGMPGYGTVTEHITTLLYLWPQERTAIGWIDSVEAGVLLRFRRDLDESTPYYDENFAQNQAPYGMKLVEHYSFGLNTTIPAAALEAARYVKRERGWEAWSAYDWRPLNQVTERTRMMVAGGRLVDEVDAHLPGPKFSDRKRARFNRW